MVPGVQGNFKVTHFFSQAQRNFWFQKYSCMHRLKLFRKLKEWDGLIKKVLLFLGPVVKHFSIIFKFWFQHYAKIFSNWLINFCINKDKVLHGVRESKRFLVSSNFLRKNLFNIKLFDCAQSLKFFLKIPFMIIQS